MTGLDYPYAQNNFTKIIQYIIYDLENTILKKNSLKDLENLAIKDQLQCKCKLYLVYFKREML